MAEKKNCKNCASFVVCSVWFYSYAPCAKWQPTIVYCKDCKNWMYEFDNVGLCVTDVPDVDGVQRLDCDYCSYGERKDA